MQKILQAHSLKSYKSNILLTILWKIFILQALFQSAEHNYEKKKDLEPDPYLCLMDPDPGGPKTCGPESGSVPPTLVSRDGYNITTDLGAPTASLRAGSGSTAWTAVLWVSLKTIPYIYLQYMLGKKKILKTENFY
jgi:hypothetical protein